jgi:hypothetical protein
MQFTGWQVVILLVSIMVCGTVLVVLHIVPPEPLTHLAGVIVGGILGVLSPKTLQFPAAGGGGVALVSSTAAPVANVSP